MTFEHRPVLLNETLDLLAVQPGDVFVDCTLGGGGHTRAVLDRLGGKVSVIGIDQDATAIQHARATLPSNVTIVQDNFRNLKSIILSSGLQRVNRILMDLGVSSPQLDEAERGFSYQHDAPLDMRMDRRRSTTARQLVNELPEDELARIIQEYGEERWAKRIARFVVEQRNQAPIESTGELVRVIKKAIPQGAREEGPHPAKRTFQALRIAVNGELDIIEPALRDAVELLSPGGRLAVITFHSLEDRIVKHSFKEMEKGCVCPPRLPTCICGKRPMIELVNRKPVVASEAELESNPRSRSAKLRVAEKVPQVLVRIGSE